jgi:UDP-N-acetylmuramyl pentapeptide phosphotransferase/UDP-N-acetylglucosamine-1-phosphate transferase
VNLNLGFRTDLEPLYLAIFLSSICFIISFLLISFSINFLRKRCLVVEDFHKNDKRLVPKPAGPAIFTGIGLPLIFLFIYTSEIKYFAVFLSISIIFLIGLVDDLKVLSGKLKTLLTILGSFPLLFFGVYDPHLIFPIFGSTRLTIVYPLIVLFAIPVIANAFNMIDVYNGTISGSSIILSFSQIIPILLYGSYENIIFPLLLLAASFTFYLFNKYPSKIFAGDSGSLLFGALFGASAIVTRTEIPSLIAFVPAILNGFFILASIKGIIEHRSIKVRPVHIDEGGLLVASKDKNAPITLARLIVADGPMSEKKAATRILLLFVYSTLLAILTSLLIKG